MNKVMNVANKIGNLLFELQHQTFFIALENNTPIPSHTN
jgi:hypothetical protein